MLRGGAVCRWFVIQLALVRTLGHPLEVQASYRRSACPRGARRMAVMVSRRPRRLQKRFRLQFLEVLPARARACRIRMDLFRDCCVTDSSRLCHLSSRTAAWCVAQEIRTTSVAAPFQQFANGTLESIDDSPQASLRQLSVPSRSVHQAIRRKGCPLLPSGRGETSISHQPFTEMRSGIQSQSSRHIQIHGQG